MRCLGLIMALVLMGCSTMSLEELEAEAARTGDWSKVEKREAAIERRKARQGPTCPGELVAWCEVWGGRRDCTCVTRETMNRGLEW